MRFKVKSQLPHVEKPSGWIDDCGPSSIAAAVAWAAGYEFDPSAADGIKAAAKAGRIDRPNEGNGTSLAQLVKAAKIMGANARWAKNWADVVASAKAGAAIGINVEQPRNYPKGVEISAWHRAWAKSKKRKPGDSYGHMTAAGWDAELGWQWACPTRSGKGKEVYGVLVTEEQLKKIASSKGDAPHKRCIIVTWPKAKDEKAATAALVEVPAPETAHEVDAPTSADPNVATPTPVVEVAPELPLISPESPVTPAVLIDPRPATRGPVRRPMTTLAPKPQPVAPKMPQAVRPGFTIDWAAFVLAIFKKITGRS